MDPERTLRLLFRLIGVVLLLAIPAILLPTETMARIHATLGLGEMPRGPLVEYLTRSISALYAYHGGVFLLMATDLRRYRDLALYFGLGDMVFGAVVFAIGLYAGLPPIWLWGEGPPTVLIGLVIAWLARRIPTEERPRPR
jgi:hypothetical protein